MRSLYILRGLPGGGKSTLARELSENRWPVLSIDSYFTDEHGAYKFESANNHLAYKKCQGDVEAAMNSGVEKIFVDNTFTLEWEMTPYFELAAKNKYRVFVITVENRHGGSNTHGISKEQIKKMAEKYKVVLF